MFTLEMVENSLQRFSQQASLAWHALDREGDQALPAGLR